jgi:malate/lactate dehydrogenase
MKRSVGIIGTGRVGSSVALCTLHSGVVDELLLNDLKTELVEGDGSGPWGFLLPHRRRALGH